MSDNPLAQVMMKNEAEGMPSAQQRQGTFAVVPSPPPPHAAAVYVPSANQQHLTPQQHLKPHQHVQPQQHLQPQQQQQQAPSVEEEQVIEDRQALQLLMAKRQQHLHDEEKILPLKEEECQRRGQLRRIEKQQRRGSGDEVQQWMKAQWQPQKKEQQRLRMEEAERQQYQQELVCRRICCDSRCKSVPLDSSSIRDSRNISGCDNDSLNCGRPTVGGARVAACRDLLTTRTAVQSFAAAGALPRTPHPELQQRRAAVAPCSHRSVVFSKRIPLPGAPTPRRQTAASNNRKNTYSPLRSACAAFSTERQASAEELPLREPLYRQQEQQHGQQQQQLERHTRPEKQEQKQPQQQHTRRKRQQQQQNRKQQQQQRHGEQQQQEDDSGRRTSRPFAAADLLNLPELCIPLLEEAMETGTSVDFGCESPDRSSAARDASCLSSSSSSRSSSFCVAVSSSGAAITPPLSEPSFSSCSVCHSAFLSGSSYLEELAAPSSTVCLPQCCLSMCNNTALPPASPRCARSSLHDRQSSGFLRSSFQCQTCLDLTSPSPYSLSCPSLPAATAGSADATCNSSTASRSASISLIATSASPHAQETFSTPRSSLHSTTLTPVSLQGSVAVAAETLPPAAAARIAFLPGASAADEAGDSSTTTTTAAAAALSGGGVHSKACSAVTRCTAGVSGATAVADFDVAADARAEGGRRCCTRPGEEYWEGEKVSLPSIARSSSSSSNACCNRAQQEDLCGGYVTGGRGRNSQRHVSDPVPAGREPNTAAAGATAFRIAEAAPYAAESRRVSVTTTCELAPSSGDAAAASSVFSAASGNVAARGEPIWDLCDGEGLTETTEENSAAQHGGCWWFCRSGSAGAFACVRLPVSPSKVANRLPLPHWLGTVLAGLVVLPLQLPLLLLQVLAGLLLQLLHPLIPPPLPPYFSWKVFRAFLGPGWLIAMAYLDPGNLEGDLQAGSYRRALAESSRASLDVSPTDLAKAFPYRFPPLPETSSQHPDASAIPTADVAAAAAAASAADTAGDAADAVQHSTLLLLALQRLWPQQQQHWKPVKQQLPPKDEEEESRYSLLWVLLWGHAAGGVFQILAARLGNTTGLDLATLCRRQLSRRMAAILWLLTELAVIGADVQAVLGCAVALKLLVNAPVWLGVLVTLVDCFTLLWFNGERTVQLENFFGACIGLMALAFLYTAAISRPAVSQVLQGLLLPTVPSFSRGDALTVLGLLGGILMPHNVFLHSALVLTRNVSRSSPAAVAEANYYFSVETAMALFVSLILNCSVLCAFASPLIYVPLETPLTFETAPKALETAFGRKAVYIWASGLLAAGQNAAIAGTYAGQFIMQGLLDLHFSRPVRLAVTRLVTIVPLAALAYVDQDVVDTICRLVNMSQAILLPFTLIPLVGLNSCPQVMGMFRLCGWRLYTVWLLAGAVTAASALVAFTQFVSLHPTPQLWVLFLLLASLYGALLAALHHHRQPDISCAYLLAEGTR